MKVIPIFPIISFYGKLSSRDPFYFRRSRKGYIYACRCPKRTNRQPSEAELANRRRFAETWGKRYKKDDNCTDTQL